MKKTKKEKSRGRKIIEWIFFGVFGALFIFVLAGVIDGKVHANEHYGHDEIRFGYGTFVVVSDSMEPEIKKGAAVVSHLDSLDSIYEKYLNNETIDVTFADVNRISYRPPSDSGYYIPTDPTGLVMTHRLRYMDILDDGTYVFIASGINDEGDYSKAGQYQNFTNKELLGVVKINSLFLGQTFSVLFSPIGLLIFLLVPSIYLVVSSVIDIFKVMDKKEEAVIEGGELKLSKEDKERLKKELLNEMLEKRKNDEDK